MKKNRFVNILTNLLASSESKAIAQHPFQVKELAILFSMLFLICFILFNKFILGSAVYLFKDIGSDTLNLFYPSYINVSEMLHESGLPGWSFEKGLGQNVFPFSLSDPTTYLLYIVSSSHLAFGIVWVEIFKIICSGLLFFLFLKKLSLNTKAAYIGGLLFAFSGYMIVGGSWYIFSTLGLYVALVLLSFEMLYLENRWWLFPIAIALLASFNFVNLYTCSFFLLLYIFFRVLADEEFNYKKFTSLLRRLFFLGALGVLISAVFSVPNLYQMIDSPRVSGNASMSNELLLRPIFNLGTSNYMITLIMRAFSNDLLGNGSYYKGWGNYLEAPMHYCGLLSLLLTPQIFTFLKLRQRIVFGIFIGIFIFAEIFPWFRMGFWLFQGDYFRDFSLYVSIIYILFSVLALDKMINDPTPNLWVLMLSLSALLLLLYFPYDLTLHGFYGNTKFESVLDRGLQAKVALFLVLITLIIFLFYLEKCRKYVPICILAITLAEIVNFNYDTINKRDVVSAEEMQNKTGYNDYSLEAIVFIKQQDKDFFRIEKNYSSSPAILAGLNDSMVQHYFGSSSYNSFSQSNYVNFLNSCGVLNSTNKTETAWIFGTRKAPLLQVLTDVRYLLFKGNWKTHSALTSIYSEIGTFNDVTVLKSRYALPMGVAYDNYMVQSDFNGLDTERKQIALLKAIMIPDILAPELTSMTRVSARELYTTNYSANDMAMDTNKLQAQRLHISSFSNNTIDGNINTKIKQLVFFSIPFDRGWTAKVNGNVAPILMVDGGLSAVLIAPGNNIISLHYSTPFVEMGFYLSLLGLFVFGLLLNGIGKKTAKS